MRVAVTGAAGRLGSALVTRLSAADAVAGWEVLPWTRAEFDLDDPDPIAARITLERPDLVIHAAAWADVDGCAREPEVALRRNGEAARVLARACAGAGASLILVSTNEVFDGERTDGLGYRTVDPTNPANAYGRSKLEGERLAQEAYAGAPGRLAIARTAWLFGAGKPDFPARIAAGARQAAAEGRPLRVVADEIGTPTFVADLANAIVRAAELGLAGVLHLVNAGQASRAEWARDVIDRLAIPVEVEDISLDDYQRPSRPPRWGVLEPTPAPGAPMRHWREAMAERVTLGGLGT